MRFFGSSSLLQASALLATLAAVEAQTPTDEASEAAIADPVAECQPYYWAPSGQVSSQFPTNWEPAEIVNGDTDATNLWNSIQSQIPSDVQVKGTQPASLMGDFTGYNYSADDPDCWWTYSKCDTPKHQGIASDIINVPEPDTLGYGFDDGPNCSHNAFYDFLESKNQKATMFYIGSNVQNWPLQAQRAVTDGHQICVHTWSHRYMTSLTSEEVFAEFYYTKKMIQLVTGVTPLCWRPPYGDVDDRVRAIAQALNLSTIVWESDSFDWEAGTNGYTDQDVYDNYETLIQQAQNGTFSTAGTIMLTHELNNFTMQTAINYYDQLASAFKYLVPVGVGYNQTNPYVESNVTLPTFEQYISGQTTSSGSSSGSGSSSSSSSSSQPSSTGSSGSSGSGAGSGVSTGSNGAASSSMQIGMGALVATSAFVGGLLALGA